MKRTILFLVLILVLISAYSFYHLKFSSASNSTARFLTTFELLNTSEIKYKNVSEKEADIYLRVVRKFEEYQRNHDSHKVLLLFTSPKTDKEKEQLLWLEGFFPKQAKPRLYANNQVNFKLNWFMIKSVNRSSDNTVTVEILESRTYYDPFGNPNKHKEVYETKQNTYLIDFKKDKIERYFTLRDKGKYSGFY